MIATNSLARKERLASILDAVALVAKSGKYTEGAATFKLESGMSHLMHGQPAISVNSRGSALFATYDFYFRRGIRKVAIQNNSFVAVGAMAVQAEMEVYLVDSSEKCPAMGVDALRKVLSDHPDIQLVVIQHVGGWLAKDYYKILDLCSEKGVLVIEDCATMLGHPAIGKDYLPSVGTDAAIWSFQQTSSLPVGGGAVITTMNLELRNHLRLFRSFGKHCTAVQVMYGEGLDLRMSEWEAAIACVQLDSIQNIIEARKRDFAMLESIAPCLLEGETSYQCYPVHQEDTASRKTAPSCYSLQEQLISTLLASRFVAGNLEHSYAWSQAHKCLPIGEGLYDDTPREEVFKVLHRASS
jgi:dTDP-4-amino-4,6-dideoxygalactose transaminase